MEQTTLVFENPIKLDEEVNKKYKEGWTSYPGDFHVVVVKEEGVITKYIQRLFKIDVKA